MHIEHCLEQELHLALQPRTSPLYVGLNIAGELSKRHYRGGNSHLGRAKCTSKTLKTRVRAALRMVDISSVLKFARKTRRYRWVYSQKEASLASYGEIENLMKVHKSHRNVLDQFKKMFDVCLSAPAATAMEVQ